MPWTERSAMDLRLCFIAAHTRDDVPFGALCARYGISRMTGYKWVGRYRAFGAAGLADRSRARLDQLLSMLPETSEAVLALRERHPSWGPRKLLARLAEAVGPPCDGPSRPGLARGQHDRRSVASRGCVDAAPDRPPARLSASGLD